MKTILYGHDEITDFHPSTEYKVRIPDRGPSTDIPPIMLSVETGPFDMRDHFTPVQARELAKMLEDAADEVERKHPAELLAAGEQDDDTVRDSIQAHDAHDPPIGTHVRSRLGNTGEVTGWDDDLDLPLVTWGDGSRNDPEACKPHEYTVIDELDAATGEGRR